MVHRRVIHNLQFAQIPNLYKLPSSSTPDHTDHRAKSGDHTASTALMA